MKVRGWVRDLRAFTGLSGQRAARLAAPAEPLEPGGVNELARALHPEALPLRVVGVRDEGPEVRTWRLAHAQGGPLPWFRAGQYLSITLEVDGVVVNRPWSISSTPDQALEGFVELTIQRRAQGFVSQAIWEGWTEGTLVQASGPEGTFWVDPLRDARHILCLAGGVGITPFKAIIAHELVHRPELRFTLVHGVRTPAQRLFTAELEALAQQHPGRLELHVLYSEQGPDQSGPTGLITAERVREHLGGEETTLMVCGPPGMLDFLRQQLPALGLPRRRIRWEVFGAVGDPRSRPDYPQDAPKGPFRIRARAGGREHEVKALAHESVLVSLERAGLAPPARCRSGECGWCRADLLEGEVWVLPEGDGRMADLDHGAFHPCSSYPLSDLVIRG